MTERDETSRIIAWHREMERVHLRLREALEVVREAALSGGEVPGAERELLLYCHGFCQALSGHHEAEDRSLFPELLRRRPDLTAVVHRLEQDHAAIEQLLVGLRDVLDAGADPVTVTSHLDGVTAIMESHFRYEERELLAPLASFSAEGDGPRLSRREAFGPLGS